jgi:6-phosphogluconolactonase
MNFINIYDTPEEVVVNFAEYLKLLAEESISLKGNFNLALSGGSTPQLLYTELEKNYKNKIEWDKVHFYWGDERCVVPDSSESNYGMASKLFLNYINIPEKNIHRIKGELDPNKEAIRYSNEISANLPLSNNIPQFDLIILGIGNDGHTASIFPDQIGLMTSDKICETAIHPNSQQKRITLTGKIINNSKNASFLVTSKEKSKVVAEILMRKSEYKNYPASYIKLTKGILDWYLDKEAGQLVSSII